MTYDHRCVSAVRLPSGQIKRCTRYLEHESDHLWVESLDRVGGNSVVILWLGGADVADPARIGYVHPQPSI